MVTVLPSLRLDPLGIANVLLPGPQTTQQFAFIQRGLNLLWGGPSTHFGHIAWLIKGEAETLKFHTASIARTSPGQICRSGGNMAVGMALTTPDQSLIYNAMK
jgi:hypothetical protein